MRAILVALAIATAVPMAALAKARPISKLEARALSTAQTKQRVLEQFAAILTEGPRQKTRHPVMPLSDLWYSTKVRSTDYVGLCSYDTVIFKFHPVGDRERNARTPVAVDGIEVRTSYRFNKPADLVTDDGPAVRASDRARCARLDPRKVRFFSAPDETTALSAGHRFANLLARLGPTSKDKSLTVECPEFADDECRMLVSSMSLDRIESADRCASDAGDGECWEVQGWDPRERDYALELFGRVGDAKATKVILRQLLVIADERRD